jgi:hypothetical protein
MRRFVVSVGAGVAAGAAVAAIVIVVHLQMNSAASENLLPSQSVMQTVAVTLALCVVAALAVGRLGRDPYRPILIALLAIAAAALSVWAVWAVANAYRVRASMPLVDSTGVTVVAAGGALAAVLAALSGFAVALFVGRVSVPTAVCVSLAVLVAVPAIVVRSAISYRADVWYPDSATAHNAPAPLPDAGGPVRYWVGRLDSDARVHVAGNGFVVSTDSGLTAYDGQTGEVRWRADDFGPYGDAGSVQVAWRDEDDRSGVVVFSVADAVIALDGSSGDVIWRRQFRGELTSLTASVDALGMTIFDVDVDGPKPDRTRIDSLDPSTGRLRWSAPISCDGPSPGQINGRLAYSCLHEASNYDARTGDVSELADREFENLRVKGDVYVSSADGPTRDDPIPAGSTVVIDPAGEEIDRIPATYPASTARRGLILLYGGPGTWLLRDYRNHRSTPVPIRLDTSDGMESLHTAWLDNGLAVVSNDDQPLLHIDLANPTAEPTVTAAPCPGYGHIRYLEAVAGALIAQCGSDTIAGLVP